MSLGNLQVLHFDLQERCCLRLGRNSRQYSAVLGIAQVVDDLD